MTTATLTTRDTSDPESATDPVFEVEQTDSDQIVVRVGNAHVVITAGGEGISITLYPSDTSRDSVTETWATWGELA